ncbi:MAG: glycosyltransferase family 39 protein [Planctomycetaceae bacterium]|nr:glycosyltransferase family 39 protein [Planctomycetaceae bacterium]
MAEEQTAGDEDSRRSAVPWLLAVILVLALIPRLQRLGTISFWFDEAYSVKMVSFGLAEILERASRDIHPPLYYWLLRVWAGGFGDSPVALRLMSVLFGVLTVLGVFLFVREAECGLRPTISRPSPFGAGVALFAAALLALSPLHIAWSLQARMYTLGTALAAFSGWFLLRALRRESAQVADWAGYVVLAVALAYTHVFGLFTIAAQAVFAIGVGIYRASSIQSRVRWNTLGAVLVAFFVVEVCWLPWLDTFLEQKQRVLRGYWIPPFRWEQVLETAYQFFAVTEHGPPPSRELKWIATGFCFALTAALLLLGRPGHRLMALGFGLPVASAMILSHFVQPLFITRYFLFAHLSLLCMFAVVVGLVPTRPARTCAIGTVLSLASILCLSQMEHREEQARLPGLAAAMRYVDAVREPGKPLLTGNPMLHLAVLSHIADRDGVRLVGSSQQFPHFQGTPVVRDDEYLPITQLSAVRANSIWIVEGINWNGGTWTVEMPEPWVSTQEARFPEVYGHDCEIVVRRYERRDSLSRLMKERENRHRGVQLPAAAAIPSSQDAWR